MRGPGIVVPLDLTEPPTAVLRRLRGEPGLVALVGEWCGGGAVLGCRPAEVLPDGADPFDLPDMWPDVWSDVWPDVWPDVWGAHDGGAAEVGGGWVALWGYPLAHRIERLPEAPPRPHPQAPHWVARYEWFLRYDGATWSFESLLAEEPATAALHAVRRTLADGDPAPRPHAFSPFAMTPARATTARRSRPPSSTSGPATSSRSTSAPASTPGSTATRSTSSAPGSRPWPPAARPTSMRVPARW